MQRLLSITLAAALGAALPGLSTFAQAPSGSDPGEGSWRPVAWDAEGPDAREHGAVIQLAGRTFVFGGSGYEPQLRPLDDLWELDAERATWVRREALGDVPGGGGSRRVAGAVGANTALLFGGYDAAMAPNAELFRAELDGDALRFTRVDQRNAPAPRFLHAFVHDAAHQRYVLFGGVGEAVYGDLWTMQLEDGVAVWRAHELEDAPSPRYGFAHGMDAALAQLVVFGGADERFGSVSPRDTWTLHLEDDEPWWELLTEGTDFGTPPERRNPCFTYDDANARLYVFGGTANGASVLPGIHVFDADPDVLEWTSVDTPEGVRDRASGMGFVTPGGRVWLGFGNGVSGAFRDVAVLGD